MKGGQTVANPVPNGEWETVTGGDSTNDPYPDGQL
jgi:hypothetical protein